MAIGRPGPGRSAGRAKRAPAAKRRTAQSDFLVSRGRPRPGMKVASAVAPADRVSVRSATSRGRAGWREGRETTAPSRTPRPQPAPERIEDPSCDFDGDGQARFERSRPAVEPVSLPRLRGRHTEWADLYAAAPSATGRQSGWSGPRGATWPDARTGSGQPTLETCKPLAGGRAGRVTPVVDCKLETARA